MKKLIVVLFMALVSVGVQAKDFGSWRLKANIDKTIGVYDGIIDDHLNACKFIQDYPVQGVYEYVLFDAC